MTPGQRVAHYAVVSAVIGMSYAAGIDRVRFFKDESHWIATSYYLEAFLGVRID